MKQFIKDLERQLNSKIQQKKTIITKELFNTLVLQIINNNKQTITSQNNKQNNNPNKPTSYTINHKQHPQQIFQAQQANIKQLYYRNQQMIMNNLQHTNYIKKERQIQFELTRQFFKQVLQTNNHKNNNILKSYSEYEQNQIDKAVSVDMEIISPMKIKKISQSKSELDVKSTCSSTKYGTSINSTLRRTINVGDQSQLKKSYQPNEKFQSNIIKKLRKLQKYVISKEKISHAERSKQKRIFYFNSSPSKQFIKEQNKNLQVVNSNLSTQIDLLERFRNIPAIEKIVERQNNLKKRQKIVKQHEQIVLKKQSELNQKKFALLRTKITH